MARKDPTEKKFCSVIFLGQPLHEPFLPRIYKVGAIALKLNSAFISYALQMNKAPLTNVLLFFTQPIGTPGDNRFIRFSEADSVRQSRLLWSAIEG